MAGELHSDDAVLECDCGAVTYVHLEYPAPQPGPGGKAEVSVTCDSCHRWHWVTITEHPEESHDPGLPAGIRCERLPRSAIIFPGPPPVPPHGGPHALAGLALGFPPGAAPLRLSGTGGGVPGSGGNSRTQAVPGPEPAPVSLVSLWFQPLQLSESGPPSTSG